ncbi:MAG: diadenylate cyclase CdaA [Bdellovibrionales bacterium]|nr:diadenylate cyclase CdaA [Bdellovibrionales bacterium]
MLHNFLENAKLFIEQLEFRDGVDLILVWLVVYRALLLTKKSGAVQILSGMGVLAIAYFLSSWFSLVTFNWILELIFSNLFLIVVILFQGEIRRALAQIGSNPLLFGASAIEVRHNIEEIAQGVVQLGQRGTGALIVIEREIVLDYFIEPGTELDSNISAEVLNSIFAPMSPLHDGAVLIRAGRIFSAGNFLPLSKNPALDKNLGTRHRAGFGLAEQTDAIVIIVSEENRSVNLVHGSHFAKDVDHGTLRRELYDLLGIKVKPEWSAAT